jgi:hypothetical protein
MVDRTKRFNTTGSRAARRRPRKNWSRRFLELAGSAPDFPYPAEPQRAEPEWKERSGYRLPFFISPIR